MLPTLSQVCTLNASLEQDFEDYAAAECESIELWWTKLEVYLEDHSEAEFQELRQRYRLATPVASYQGGLLDSQGAKRQEAWQLWARRLELAARLEIDTVIVACDVATPLDQAVLERTKVSLRQVADAATSQGVHVALEFQANSALGNNLQTAIALVEEVGHSCLGICLDTYHFFVGPSKLSDLRLLTAKNLLHVQLCDLVDVPRELARDADRILPGDGDHNCRVCRPPITLIV